MGNCLGALVNSDKSRRLSMLLHCLLCFSEETGTVQAYQWCASVCMIHGTLPYLHASTQAQSKYCIRFAAPPVFCFSGNKCGLLQVWAKAQLWLVDAIDLLFPFERKGEWQKREMINVQVKCGKPPFEVGVSNEQVKLHELRCYRWKQALNSGRGGRRLTRCD